MMIDLTGDLRHVLRIWRRSPGFSAAAVVTLALGIGATTAIFSVVDAIWLRPLEIHDPEGLISISDQKLDNTDRGASYPEYLDYRTQAKSFSDVAAVDFRGTLLKTNGQTRMLIVGQVSANYFSLLGVSPVNGRIFSESELGGSNPPPLVMLSYGAWQRYFGGGPKIAGAAIVLNSRTCVVTGILPRGFRSTAPFIEPEVWMPMTTWLQVTPGDAALSVDRADHRFELFARLAPGHSLDEARSEMNLIASRLAHFYPTTDAGRKIDIAFEREARNPFLKLLSTILMALALLVLLIACANVANLLLARGEARRKEIATRVALGASRARLVGQLTFECLPLSVLGTTFAVLLANWIIRFLPSLLPPMDVPLGFDFRLDHRVLFFAACICFISTALCGLVPAFRSSAVAPVAVMKESSGTFPKGSRRLVSNLVIVVQMAASLVLLTGAGLLLKTLLRVEQRDLGFNRQQEMVLMDPAVGILRQGQLQPYIDDVIRRVKAVPGIKHAAFARFIPFGLSAGGATKVVSLPGQESTPGKHGLNLYYSNVTPEYFVTMGITIVKGRGFTDSDRKESPKVVLVSKALARQLFPGQDALDRYLRVGGANGMDWQIVGIAQDVTYNEMTESPQPYLYFPIAQEPAFEGTLAVSTATDASRMLQPLVRTVQEVNENVPVLGAHTMDVRLRSATYSQRLPAVLVGALGVLALALASVGLYGLVSYMVVQRTREIGIRIAMGAVRTSVLRLEMGRGLRLTAVGALIGLPLALAAAHMLSSLLYDVSPFDPVTFAVVTSALVLVSGVASLIPARRASKIDPIVALRYE
jgi:predicted permease